MSEEVLLARIHHWGRHETSVIFRNIAVPSRAVSHPMNWSTLRRAIFSRRIRWFVTFSLMHGTGASVSVTDTLYGKTTIVAIYVRVSAAIIWDVV